MSPRHMDFLVSLCLSRRSTLASFLFSNWKMAGPSLPRTARMKLGLQLTVRVLLRFGSAASWRDPRPEKRGTLVLARGVPGAFKETVCAEWDRCRGQNRG